MRQALENKEQILDYVQSVMNELFDIEKTDITPEANLYQDLDIDSIDAVDLVVEIKKYTGKKISPEDFKNVATVQDVVDAVYLLVH
ncbi:MAG TPA: acyl carrier protein [Gammaproteobacteria bacterium]|nr:acyl carrier protein [Gammaproteobacteria bacterium]